MYSENILSLLPQQPPFVMVDKIFHCDENGIQTGFSVTAENVLVVNSRFTEAGIMENIAQTAAARAGYMAKKENKAVAVGYIAAVKNFDVFDLPETGDQLVTDVMITEKVFDNIIISGTVRRNDMVVAKCEMNIFISK